MSWDGGWSGSRAVIVGFRSGDRIARVSPDRLGLNLCVVPPITYLSLISDGEKILLEQSEEGRKTKSRFKTDFDKTSTRCLNKKRRNIRVCNMATSTW